MTDIKIGISDRGTWDKEDNINASLLPLKKGLNAQEAEEFIKINPGAELVIKEKDGKYSIYKLSTSEQGKGITSQDFKDKSITIQRDSLKIFGGEKAYISTDDNVIHSLDIEGLELSTLDVPYINSNLTINIKDIDGIETNSKNDIIGTISGNLTIKKELLMHALSEANKKDLRGIKANLNTFPLLNQYTVDITYKGFIVGRIVLTPNKVL